LISPSIVQRLLLLAFLSLVSVLVTSGQATRSSAADGAGALIASSRAENLSGEIAPATRGGPKNAESPSNDGSIGASRSTSPLLGLNAHPLQNIYSIYPADLLLDRAVEAGARVLRVDVHWDWLEWTGPGVDQWDPDQTQRLGSFLESAKRHHVKVLAVVMDTPCWASSDPAKICGGDATRYNWREPPSDPGDFAAFCSLLARRFPGEIQYWEIWNEPNLPQFWTHPDPAAYANLLRVAYPAIKTADSSATVLAGALAPIEPGQNGIATFRFVDEMYAAGALGSFDALSFHPYSNGKPPGTEQPGWTAHSISLAIPELRAAMLRFGDHRPIWLTEVGWPTASPCFGCALPSFLPTEGDQAIYLADVVRLASRWDFVAGLIWYELFDRGPNAAPSPEDHFGLFRHDLTPKPAVSVLRSLSQGDDAASTGTTPAPPQR
jgi:hypothetical protein